jgi:hypothetical protein
MARFTGLLKVEVSADGKMQRLLEPLVWEVDELGSGQMVEIPAGHVADGVSRPWILGWLIPRHFSRADRPARLHDYGLNLIETGAPHKHMPTTAAVHRQFRIAMVAVGYSNAVAWTWWAAVSLWGYAKQLLRG